MGVFSHCTGKRVSAETDYDVVLLSDLPVKLNLKLWVFSQAFNTKVRTLLRIAHIIYGHNYNETDYGVVLLRDLSLM